MSLQVGPGTHFCLSCLWPKNDFRGERCPSCSARIKARGCVFGDEWKIKMKLSRMSHPISPETRTRMSASLMGHPVSLETRNKLRLASAGRHPSDETKEKIRASLIGRPLNGETLIKLRATARSPEHRERVSLGNKKRFSRQGELDKISGTNSCHWRGGIPKPYASEFTKELKEIIRKRDDYLCQNPSCYLPENGRVHDIHHIDDHRFNNNTVNLITLCRKCHSRATNGDMDYWQEYYQSLQEMRKII